MDEVVVKMGLDESALSRGLRTAEHQVDEFGHHVKEQLNDGFKELIAPISAAGVIGGIEKVFGTVQQIERVAEATGLTAENYQRLAFAAKEAGIESTQFERSMEFLSKTIGEAAQGQQQQLKIFEKYKIAIKDSNGEVRDTGKILDDVSNAIAGLGSKAERAAAAQELLGKSGAKMVGLLSAGAKELHARGEGAAVFSDADIENIKQAHEQIERVENSLTVGLGKVISVVADASKVLGEFFGLHGTKGYNQIADANEDMVEKLKQHAEYIAHLKAEEEKKRFHPNGSPYSSVTAEPDKTPSRNISGSVSAAHHHDQFGHVLTQQQLLERVDQIYALMAASGVGS